MSESAATSSCDVVNGVVDLLIGWTRNCCVSNSWVCFSIIVHSFASTVRGSWAIPPTRWVGSAVALLAQTDLAPVDEARLSVPDLWGRSAALAKGAKLPGRSAQRRHAAVGLRASTYRSRRRPGKSERRRN